MHNPLRRRMRIPNVLWVYCGSYCETCCETPKLQVNALSTEIQWNFLLVMNFRKLCFLIVLELRYIGFTIWFNRFAIGSDCILNTQKRSRMKFQQTPSVKYKVLYDRASAPDGQMLCSDHCGHAFCLFLDACLWAPGRGVPGFRGGLRPFLLLLFLFDWWFLIQMVLCSIRLFTLLNGFRPNQTDLYSFVNCLASYRTYWPGHLDRKAIAKKNHCGRTMTQHVLVVAGLHKSLTKHFFWSTRRFKPVHRLQEIKRSENLYKTAMKLYILQWRAITKQYHIQKTCNRLPSSGFCSKCMKNKTNTRNNKQQHPQAQLEVQNWLPILRRSTTVHSSLTASASASASVQSSSLISTWMCKILWWFHKCRCRKRSSVNRKKSSVNRKFTRRRLARERWHDIKR